MQNHNDDYGNAPGYGEKDLEAKGAALDSPSSPIDEYAVEEGQARPLTRSLKSRHMQMIAIGMQLSHEERFDHPNLSA